MSKTSIVVIGIIVLGLCAIGCENAIQPVEQTETQETELTRLAALACPPAGGPPPSPLVNVGVGSEYLNFWPYIGVNFSGESHDPINLIFYGEADPLEIRAALLALDGDRRGFPFPPVPPTLLDASDNNVANSIL